MKYQQLILMAAVGGALESLYRARSMKIIEDHMLKPAFGNKRPVDYSDKQMQFDCLWED